MDAEAVQPEKHLLLYGLSRAGRGFAYSVLERIRAFQPDLHLTAVHPEMPELPAAGLGVIASARDAVPPATRAMLVLNAEDTREALNDVAAAGIEHVWLVMHADTRENLRFAREQGMRFLSDYLNGDQYFRIHRPGHNLDRCRTQFKMVADMEEKFEQMQRIIERYR